MYYFCPTGQNTLLCYSHQAIHDKNSNRIRAADSTSSISEELKVISNLEINSRGFIPVRLVMQQGSSSTDRHNTPPQTWSNLKPSAEGKEETSPTSSTWGLTGERDLVQFFQGAFCSVPNRQQDQRSQLHRMVMSLTHLSPLSRPSCCWKGSRWQHSRIKTKTFSKSIIWYSSCHNSNASPSPQGKAPDEKECLRSEDGSQKEWKKPPTTSNARRENPFLPLSHTATVGERDLWKGELLTARRSWTGIPTSAWILPTTGRPQKTFLVYYLFLESYKKLLCNAGHPFAPTMKATPGLIWRLHPVSSPASVVTPGRTCMLVWPMRGSGSLMCWSTKDRRVSSTWEIPWVGSWKVGTEQWDE